MREEYRLIRKLDKSIFTSVCKDLRAAMDAGKPVFPVSLNFSRLDFELMDAVQELENMVLYYRIPRELIHVEVTESLIVNSFEEGSAARSFAYQQFFNALEQTVEELTKCFLLEFGDNKSLSYGSCSWGKSFNELYDGLANME